MFNEVYNIIETAKNAALDGKMQALVDALSVTQKIIVDNGVTTEGEHLYYTLTEGITAGIKSCVKRGDAEHLVRAVFIASETQKIHDTMSAYLAKHPVQ